MGIKFFAVAIAVFASAFTLCGQTAAVADLQQDMALLKREVGQLRLEVEQLRRENEELLRKIKQSSNDDNENVKQQLSFAKSEISAQNETLKREIISLVKKDLESMAAQTNANMQKLAAAIGTRPQANLPTTFPTTIQRRASRTPFRRGTQ